jgi:hypothetical protein
MHSNRMKKHKTTDPTASRLYGRLFTQIRITEIAFFGSACNRDVSGTWDVSDLRVRVKFNGFWSGLNSVLPFQMPSSDAISILLGKK